jgi:pyruvate kinase
LLRFAAGPVQWRTGDEVRVTVEDVPGTHDRVSTTYAGLARDARRRLGLFLPGMNVSLPVLSARDITALEFALRLRVDLVALSFVRSPVDIDMVHHTMDKVPGGWLPVIAKLEKPEAVDNLEAIVLAFDGVMVARGDLGVELPLENVPLMQKRAIQVARENAKPIIAATQMLDSKTM